MLFIFDNCIVMVKGTSAHCPRGRIRDRDPDGLALAIDNRRLSSFDGRLWSVKVAAPGPFEKGVYEPRSDPSLDAARR